MRFSVIAAAISISLVSSHFALGATKDDLLNDCQDAFKEKYGEGSLVKLKRTKTYKGLTTMTFRVVPEGGTRTNMTCSSKAGQDLIIE